MKDFWMISDELMAKIILEVQNSVDFCDKEGFDNPEGAKVLQSIQIETGLQAETELSKKLLESKP